MIGIYGIFKKDTDECLYVGQSKDINGRIKSHFNGKNARFNKEEHYAQMIEQHFINDKTFRLERETYWIEQLNPKLNKIKDETNRGEYFSGEKNPCYGRTGEKNPCYGRTGANHPMYKKHHSEEAKNKIKANHADVSGSNNPMFGKYVKWINNGVTNKRVKPEELHQYLNNGWKLGRIKTIK